MNLISSKYYVEIPLHIELGIKKKKKYYLNLNSYRNWQFRVSNAIKQEYASILLNNNSLTHLPKFDKIILIYWIYYPTNRKFDVDNYGAILGKFFQDTLVKAGKIADDNYEYIPVITYRFGGVDKNNPRCVVEIKTLIEEK